MPEVKKIYKFVNNVNNTRRVSVYWPIRRERIRESIMVLKKEKRKKVWIGRNREIRSEK